MDAVQVTAGNLELLGGRLCLDFANTADWHASEEPVEYLTSYPALVAWGKHAGACSEEEGELLLDESARRPADAGDVLRRTLALREAIYRIFGALAHGERPHASDGAVLNRELAGALGHARLAWRDDGFAWQWTDGEQALDRMLWAVAWDAAELLTSEELDRVGQCGGPGCGWLFVDMSRNRSRRWCSMAYCGNRAKARRYYRRNKES